MNDTRTMLERDGDDVLWLIHKSAHIRKIHDSLCHILVVKRSTSVATLAGLQQAGLLELGFNGRYQVTNVGDRRLRTVAALRFVEGVGEAPTVLGHMRFDASRGPGAAAAVDSRTQAEKDADEVLRLISGGAHIRKRHDGLCEVLVVRHTTSVVELEHLRSAGLLKRGADDQYQVTAAGIRRLQIASSFPRLSAVPLLVPDLPSQCGPC
ncbi:hypothetical protein ACSFA0_23335 [Variovorax sp. LT1P1]|uniref:hypothetical protein n=1 Tax=Variovorax sp. LT1P1 TaxID=3443730 RepID=UPI003F45F25B